MSQVPAPSQIAPHLSGVPTSRGAAGQKCWVPSTPSKVRVLGSPTGCLPQHPTPWLSKRSLCGGSAGSWGTEAGGGCHGHLGWGLEAHMRKGFGRGPQNQDASGRGSAGPASPPHVPHLPASPTLRGGGQPQKECPGGRGGRGLGTRTRGPGVGVPPPPPQHRCFWLRSRDGGQIPLKVEVPPAWHPPQPGPAGPAPSRAPTPLRSAAHCPPLGGLAAAPHLHSDSPPPALCRCWGAPFPGQGPGLHRAPEAPRRGRPWFPPSEALAPRGLGWGAHSSSRTLTPCPAHLCLWNMLPAPSRPAARAGHSATRGTLLFFKVHPCFRTWPRSGPVSLGAILPHPKPRAGGLSLPGPPVLGHA